jgi:drug/metabolite transporter (DMT)-like permease
MRSASSRGFAITAGLVAPVTWGLTGIFVRLLHGVPTLAIVAGRLAVAALALLPWVLLRRGQIGRAALNPWALAMAGYYVLATEAFVRAPVVDVTLLVGMAPVVAVVLEWGRGRPASRGQVAGAFLAVAGLILFLRPGAGIEPGRVVGYLFALGAAVTSSAYATGLRAQAEAGRAPNALLLTLSACILGALASGVLLAIQGTHLSAGTLDARHGLELALLGLVSTAVPTLAYGLASARLPAVLTTSLGLTTPLFAAFFAGFILGEWPALSAIPGAIVALAGVVIVLRSPSRAAR